MSSLSNLYAMLRPLRLYALHRDSLIDSELHAYGAAFEMIETALETLRGAAHPQLATGGTLDLHEQAVGLPIRAGVPCDVRRGLILRRLSGPFPPTRAGMEEALAASGLVDPQIEEVRGALFVSARALAPGMSADECWQLALRALPAHLPAFIAGKTWNELESLGRSWDALDALGRSWTELALTGID